MSNYIEIMQTVVWFLKYLTMKNKSITCFTVTLTSTATLTGHGRLIARFFKYDGSDSEMIHLIYLLYDVSRG
jgi:hypothetical protein